MVKLLSYGRLFLMLAVFVLGVVPLRAHEPTDSQITVASGPVQLAGRLVVPAGPGPHPAIVFVHGSGPMTREGFAAYADAYAEMGIASLAFDKRGTGESSGEWYAASLDDLAADVASAMAYLEARDDIDADRVGVWAISQGGWIVSRLAGRGTPADFAIVISGGGAGPLVSEIFSWDNQFEQAGLSGELLEQARSIVAAFYDYYRTGEDREALTAMLDATQDTPLAELGSHLGGILVSEELRPAWAWTATYDPLPDIAEMHAPLLLMFGDADRDHPSAQAIENWRAGLAAAGNEDVSIVVFPGAGHGIRMREGFEGEGRPPFANGYRELMTGWLWSHIVHPPRQ